MENKTLTDIENRIKNEIKEKRNYRLFEISDDIFERYNNGEVNLTENLFNEFKELIQRTTNIEIEKAKLQLITEIREVIENGLYEFFSKHEFRYIKINAGQRQDIMNDLNKELLGEQQNKENEE